MRTAKCLLALVIGAHVAGVAYAQDQDEEWAPRRVGGDIDLGALIKPIKDARVLLNQRKYVAAEQAFRSLRPDFLADEVALGLGESLMGQKRYAEALSAYEALPPEQRANRDVAFTLRYAVALYSVGRREEALDRYAKAAPSIQQSLRFGSDLFPLSFEPHTTTFRQFEADARTATAFYYLEHRQPEEARPQAERALILMPDHALARCAQALALLETEPETALRKLQAVAATAPDSLREGIERAMPSLQKQAKTARLRLDAEAKKTPREADTVAL